MSNSFFPFTVTCPRCLHQAPHSDGFETDDWTDVFVFSGASPKSCSQAGNDSLVYTCPSCKSKTDKDELYKKKMIATNCIESIKDYLFQMLPYVIENKGLYDHGWEPDLDAVLYRYAFLFPNDTVLASLKKDYYDAVHNPMAFTKFEPMAGTTVIHSEMIRYRYMLRKVYLPNGLKKIADETFSECKKIKDIFIPDTCAIMGNAVFLDCHALESIHLPSEMDVIPSQFFKHCFSLRKCFLSDKIEVIGVEAFFGCKSLKNPWIPKNLKVIDDRAFFGCASITEVMIPESVVKIGHQAFGNCPDLTIKGFAGSVAEKYAEENHIPFVLL